VRGGSGISEKSSGGGECERVGYHWVRPFERCWEKKYPSGGASRGPCCRVMERGGIRKKRVCYGTNGDDGEGCTWGDRILTFSVIASVGAILQHFRIVPGGVVQGVASKEKGKEGKEYSERGTWTKESAIRLPFR